MDCLARELRERTCCAGQMPWCARMNVWVSDRGCEQCEHLAELLGTDLAAMGTAEQIRAHLFGVTTMDAEAKRLLSIALEVAYRALNVRADVPLAEIADQFGLAFSANVPRCLHRVAGRCTRPPARAVTGEDCRVCAAGASV